MAQRVALMSYPVSQSLPQRNCMNLKFSQTSLRVSKHSWLWLEISGHFKNVFSLPDQGESTWLMYAFVSVIRKAPVVQQKIIFQKPIIYKTQLNFTWKDTPNLHRSNPTLTFFFFPKNAPTFDVCFGRVWTVKVFSCTVSSSWLFCGGSAGLVAGLDVNSGELRYFGRWIFFSMAYKWGLLITY